MVPDIRRQLCSDAPLRPDRRYVLYWMVAFRRPTWNFALDAAVEYARDLDKPLLVLEALRSDHPWACDRFHRFVLDGMADNAAAFARAGIEYYPYVEPAAGAGRGLLAALAADAAVVITDDFPAFIIPGLIRAAAGRLDVRLEKIDSNGLLPLRAAGQAYPSAYAFRRHLQRTLHQHLPFMPRRTLPRGLRRAGPLVPAKIRRRWPAWPARSDEASREAAMRQLPIDHSIGASGLGGGARVARRTLDRFLQRRLATYAERRNHPDDDATSHLSPYLHFGHVSAHEVFARVMRRSGWVGHVPARGSGARDGWWGVAPHVEAFLDELVTWRELGYNMCALRPREYDRYQSLPDWARKTLQRHGGDPRPHRYSLDRLARGDTADPLWNAAQRQLLHEGRIHNYMRMLWGKKILHWTRSPRQALAFMIELNNRYALDGRNPNSYSGIFWVLGRYDRPWGPERPIFGTVRYMSSENTARKLRVSGYLERYSPAPRSSSRRGARDGTASG